MQAPPKSEVVSQYLNRELQADPLDISGPYNTYLKHLWPLDQIEY